MRLPFTKKNWKIKPIKYNRNQPVVDSFKDYLKRKDTNYAIMINGNWGSGKTFLWKNCLKPIIENDSTLIPVYLSLYGVTSVSDLDRNLFLSATPVLKNNPKYVSELGMALSKGASNFPLGEAILSILTSSTKSVAKKLTSGRFFICFDDLERTNCPLPEVLGYITRLVEHDKIKVLVIASESDIKCEEYYLKKEKLIRNTIYFQPETDTVLHSLISLRKNNYELYMFYEKNTHLILKLFNISKLNNLRILEQALVDFDFLYNQLKKLLVLQSNITNSEEILCGLLVTTLAISFETRRHNNKILEEIPSSLAYKQHITTIKIKQAQTEQRHLHSTSLNEKECKLLEFNNKYFEDFRNVFFFKTVEVYSRSSLFDNDLFNNEFKASIQIEQTHYQKLIENYFWVLSDQDFSNSLQALFTQLIEGDIHYSNYYRCYRLYSHFQTMDMLPEHMKDIDAQFLMGLEKSAEKYDDPVDISIKLMEIESDYPTSPFEKDIKQKVISVNEDKKNLKSSVAVTCLFSLMSTDFKEFIDQFQKMHTPVFKFYDMSLLLKRLKELNNHDLFCIVELMDCIHPSYHKENYENLMKLKVLIAEDLTSPYSLSQYILKKLSDKIEKIYNTGT